MITDEEKKALETMSNGGNVFLTGPTGTGKTYVLREFFNSAPEKNKIALAVTPEGAWDIGGALLSDVLPFPKEILPADAAAETVPDVLADAGLIVIDEINLLRMDQFNYFVNTLAKAKSRARLVVCGDFSMPGPIVTEKEQAVLDGYYDDDAKNGYAFLAPHWDTADFEVVVLHERLRQKSRSFAFALDAMRRGDDQWIPWMRKNASVRPASDAIFLSEDKERVNKRVDKMTRRLKGKQEQYRAETEGDLPRHLPADKLLTLKAGELVVLTADDREKHEYHRGMMGRVIRLEKDAVILSTIGGATIRVGRHTWSWKHYASKNGTIEASDGSQFTQFPLDQGYARLIDDTKGMTLDRVYIDPECTRPGELYLAVSRVGLGGDLAFSKDVRSDYACNVPDVNVFEEEFFPPLKEENVVLRDPAAEPRESEPAEETETAETKPEETNGKKKKEKDPHLVGDVPLAQPKGFWRKFLARPWGAAIVCLVIFAVADIIGSGLAYLIVPHFIGK